MYVARSVSLASWLVWIFVILMAVSGLVVGDRGEPTCAGATTGCGPEAGWQPVSTNGVSGVIVPEQNVQDLTSWGTDGPIEGVWTPEEADIVALESRIEDTAAGSRSPSAGPKPDSLNSYVRQYGGITEGGERKIFVSGFCHVDDDSWLSHAYIVMDGGNCFFQAVYNVEDHEFERFQFNGDA